MRRSTPTLALALVVLVACSGDDSSAPATTGPATSLPPRVTDAPASTTTATASVPLIDVPDEELAGSGRYPEQPDGVPWPTDGWPEGDLPDAVDGGQIDAAVEAAFVAPDATASMRSVVAVHGGRLVYERYHPLEGPDSIFASWSVAKSVTATLVGLAVRDGLLDVYAPTGLEEWAGDERSSITLDDLLRMSSGLEWTESFGPGTLVGDMLAAPVAAAVPMAQPLVDEPGTTFAYSTGTSAIITEILARTLGGPGQLDALIDERLTGPLGISSVEAMRDPQGVFVGGVGFDTTARDFARFGLLHLRGGVWDGRRLLDEAWIDYVRTPSVSAEAYGAHWWLRDDPTAFVATGLLGQQVIVVPELDLVVVTTSAAGGDPYSVTAVIVEQFAGAL